MPRISLQELASHLDAQLSGDPQHCVEGLADLRDANLNQLSFIASEKYLDALNSSNAGAVILSESLADKFAGNKLIVADPYLGFARVSGLFTRRLSKPAGVHPSAIIEEGAHVAATASVGANCFVGADAVIGEFAELYPGVSVGERCEIGERVRLYNNVVIYHDCQIGPRSSIHANSTIGCDGFGYAPTAEGWEKIHQLGVVRIGENVEIGANCAIDRGAIGDTEIADNVIIDNLVHIAHNVKVGEATAIAGCVGIAGSAVIGKRCTVAGAVAINGHIEIADGTHFHGGTIVTKGNEEGGAFASTPPLQSVDQWRKNSVRMRQLDKLFKQVRELEKALKSKNQ
jgi:UDP-3-O-[3-hydroxymyristoyl] glucosamine N-acyltransferase